MDSDVDNFKKDFGIIEDLSDIDFRNIQKENYKNEVNGNAFGEKLCTLYTETSCEVLKLDLRMHDEMLEKEMAVSRNFLQRHRNLNSTFLTLKKISRFCESRRLVVNIALQKDPRISLNRNEEGALCIKYACSSPEIFIEITWKIEWSLKTCDILDCIEVYYNNFELPNSKFIKEELEALTHHSLDFNLKLRLWKQLLADLSEHTRQVQATIIISDNEQNEQVDNVLIISDSDDERNQNEETCHKNKRRKVESNLSSQVIHVTD